MTDPNFVPADQESADQLSTFKRVQETENFEPDTKSREWEAIRDECVSGGAMDDRCNIVAASLGTGSLHEVAKRLSCGCILVLSGGDEEGWLVASSGD